MFTSPCVLLSKQLKRLVIFMANTSLPKWRVLSMMSAGLIVLRVKNGARPEKLKNKGGDGLFSFANSFAHFLLNEEQSIDIPTRMPITGWEVLNALNNENLDYPDIPKHKIMSRNKAAKIIQKNVRGWLVRKKPEIQEMRQFWKDIREQQQKEVILTDTKVVFKKPTPSLKKATPQKPSYLRLLEDHLDSLSVPESEKENKPLKEEEVKNPESMEPICGELGISDELLNTLTKSQLEELIRVYSMHPELRHSALKKFMESLKPHK